MLGAADKVCVVQGGQMVEADGAQPWMSWPRPCSMVGAGRICMLGSKPGRCIWAVRAGSEGALALHALLHCRDAARIMMPPNPERPPCRVQGCAG